MGITRHLRFVVWCFLFSPNVFEHVVASQAQRVLAHAERLQLGQRWRRRSLLLGRRCGLRHGAVVLRRSRILNPLRHRPDGLLLAEPAAALPPRQRGRLAVDGSRRARSFRIQAVRRRQRPEPQKLPHRRWPPLGACGRQRAACSVAGPGLVQPLSHVVVVFAICRAVPVRKHGRLRRGVRRQRALAGCRWARRLGRRVGRSWDRGALGEGEIDGRERQRLVLAAHGESGCVVKARAQAGRGNAMEHAGTIDGRELCNSDWRSIAEAASRRGSSGGAERRVRQGSMLRTSRDGFSARHKANEARIRCGAWRTSANCKQ
jgi:hypothetical protein